MIRKLVGLAMPIMVTALLVLGLGIVQASATEYGMFDGQAISGANSSSDAGARENGMRFYVTCDGNINKIKVYVGGNGQTNATYKVSLFRMSDGVKIGDTHSIFIPSGTSTGWFDYVLDNSISVSAYTDYILSVNPQKTGAYQKFVYINRTSPYAFAQPHFSKMVVRPANPFYIGSTGQIPGENIVNQAYFIDVAFEPNEEPATIISGVSLYEEDETTITNEIAAGNKLHSVMLYSSDVVKPTGKLITALYLDDKLVSVLVNEITPESFTENTAEVNLDYIFPQEVTTDNRTKLKTMLWTDMNNIVPICNNLTYNNY